MQNELAIKIPTFKVVVTHRYIGKQVRFYLDEDVLKEGFIGKYALVNVTLSRSFWKNRIFLAIGSKNILETQTSGLANAAGWSGIGIVEGMAMSLDGFGHSGIAQKIVDAFELIWANETIMNEGNAFLAARAKAIEEDAAELKRHPFFEEINWDQIAKMEYETAFKPKVKGAEDVSCIDKLFTREGLEETYVDPSALNGQQKNQTNFQNFTYAQKSNM